MKIDQNTNQCKVRDKQLEPPREEYMEHESADRHIVRREQPPAFLQRDLPATAYKIFRA